MSAPDSPPTTSSPRLGPWGWIAIIVIFAFLAVALAYAIYGWNSIESVSIPTAGWIVLGIGVVATLGVGGGLMALLFYSSRKQYDRDAHGMQQRALDDRE